jgi:hypothetical protein
MTKLAITPLIAIGLTAAAAAILPAPLIATAAADTTAANTIKYWQDQGYIVNIDRVGSAPLDKCTVTDVRNPLTIAYLNHEQHAAGHAGELVPFVVSKTIKISLDCTAKS